MSNTRKLIRELSAGKMTQENLSTYVEQSMRTYHRLAELKLMMEYYTFYEVCEEGLNPYLKDAQEDIRFVDELVGKIYVEKISTEDAQEWMKQAHAVRGRIAEKMQVATSYVDMCIVFEYILNRLQYRFESMEDVMDDETLTKEVIQFIFGVNDNVVVNENIRTVLGQLPVRMTKSRYFDLVRESLSVYKEGEVSSLDNYLYMFRTSALLYEPSGMGEHFPEFASLIAELSALDFESLDYDAYRIYSEKIANAAQKLKDISDLYMSLQQIVNDLYTILLNLDSKIYENDSTAARTVIEGIWRLRTENEGDFFARGEGECPETDEEKMTFLTAYMVHTEGAQEELYEKSIFLEAVQHEVAESAAEKLAEHGLSGEMAKLQLSSQLMSSSLFIDLDGASKQEPVTAEYLREKTEELVGELERVFKGKGKHYRRAVMAATLEKMPVFFTSAEEVAEYVRTSLSMCTDAGEKYAVQVLLKDLMEEQ